MYLMVTKRVLDSQISVLDSADKIMFVEDKFLNLEQVGILSIYLIADIRKILPMQTNLTQLPLFLKVLHKSVFGCFPALRVKSSASTFAQDEVCQTLT
jgi:hypothetical protein